jgi:hypothetical protein
VYALPSEGSWGGRDEKYRTSPVKTFVEDFENSELVNKIISYKSPFLEKFKRNMQKNCKQSVTAQDPPGTVENFTKTVDDRLKCNKVFRYSPEKRSLDKISLSWKTQ